MVSELLFESSACSRLAPFDVQLIFLSYFFCSSFPIRLLSEVFPASTALALPHAHGFGSVFWLISEIGVQLQIRYEDGMPLLVHALFPAGSCSLTASWNLRMLPGVKRSVPLLSNWLGACFVEGPLRIIVSNTFLALLELFFSPLFSLPNVPYV